jgi:hypothetical protein
MNLDELVGGDAGIDALAKQVGVPREQAERGAAALLPSVLQGFGQRQGAAGGGLGGMLEQLGGGGLADNVIGAEPTRVEKGNDILGQIFGSKDRSREIAGQASQTSGVDPALLKKMLPILAMLVGGYLSSRGGRGGVQGGGGIGDILGGVLGQMGGASAGGGMGGGGLGGGGLGGGLGGVLGSILGGRR